MPTLSESFVSELEEERLAEAENSSFILKVAQKIMNQKAVFLREEEKRKTKPCIFDHPHVLQRLAMAFSIGGTIEEAAHYAGCSVSTVKKHIRERTPFQCKDPFGEDCVITFDEMVEGWRCYLPLLAKRRICEALNSPDEKLAVKTAWKLLERTEPEEWGRVCRQCHRRG
jgi:hypothetical protein